MGFDCTLQKMRLMHYFRPLIDIVWGWSVFWGAHFGALVDIWVPPWLGARDYQHLSAWYMSLHRIKPHFKNCCWGETKLLREKITHEHWRDRKLKLYIFSQNSGPGRNNAPRILASDAVPFRNLSLVQYRFDYYSESKFQKEINTDNPLGSGGKLVLAFAVLLKVLWSGKHYSYPPSKLKVRVVITLVVSILRNFHCDQFVFPKVTWNTTIFILGCQQVRTRKCLRSDVFCPTIKWEVEKIKGYVVKL